MGLDMFLEAETYLSRYNLAHDAKSDAYSSLLDMLDMTQFASGGAPVATVSVTVGYWRSANAIHSWFVRNVQGGQDDCERYYVSRESIADLYLACTTALLDRDSSVLPPIDSTMEIGKWYWRDLEDTRTMLKPLLDAKSADHFSAIKDKLPLDDWSFYYHSSW